MLCGKWKLSDILQALLVIITFPPLLVVLILIFAFLFPLLVFQIIIRLVANILHPDWSIAVGVTALFTADNLKKPQATVVGLDIVQGKLSLEELRKNATENVILLQKPGSNELVYPKLQQYFESWWGYSFWKTDRNFRIENHIQLLPQKSETEVTTEKELLEILGPLNASPCEEGRPPWKIYLIPNYVPEGGEPMDRTGILYRVHHGMSDAYSFFKLTKHVCQVDHSQTPLSRKMEEKLNQPMFNGVLEFIWLFVSLPYSGIKGMLVDVDRNAWFLPSRKLTRETLFSATKKFQVASIKRACKQHNVSFTCILFSVLAGAINTHFKKKEEKKAPEILRCLIAVPWKNHPENELSNHL